MLPLSALRLVARHGIGILHLQGVVVGIVAHLHHPVVLQGDVGIVVAHSLKEGIALLPGERWRARPQRVEDNGAGEFAVVVVGQREGHIGKAQPIEVAVVAHTPHPRPVAIGKEVEPHLLLFGPVIVVSHHHEHIARRQFLLSAKHAVADALVVDVGAFVRSGEHNGLIVAYPAVTGIERLYQFVAWHQVDVGEPFEPHLREQRLPVAPNHPPHHSGVVEDARLLSLAKHLVELAMHHMQSVACHEVGIEGWRLLLAHRWQLCGVADKEHPAVLSGVDKTHQVVEQPATAKSCVALSLIGNHRCLVDDEEGVAVQVVAQEESRHLSGKRLLPVYPPVDGKRGVATIEREHLCRPPCGCQQHHFLSHGHHRPDESPCHGGLSRACRPAHNHHGVVVGMGHERSKHPDGMLLFCRGLQLQGVPHPVG